MIETDIDQRVVDRHAGGAEDENQLPLPADAVPVDDRVPPGERQQQRERERPADLGEGDRRNVVDDVAAERDIAAPEKAGEAQQEIRLVVEPLCRASGGRHEGHRERAM
jgi:hypothetical protein